MTTLEQLQEFCNSQNYKFIFAADAETRVTLDEKGELKTITPAGGVAVALDPIAQAAKATYIARGKTEGDKEVKTLHIDDSYTLRRLFFTEEEVDNYYRGFSNQTLWPLCHVAFEKPLFHDTWYAGYKKVNKEYAKAIEKEIDGNTFVWIHDYQLTLVPKYLNRPKDTIVSLFWHIPWPTWEVFRILPQKHEILESLLSCDFLAFHRGYQVRNFLDCVEREFEARIDQETNKVYYNKKVTTVMNLPLGIDTDVIQEVAKKNHSESFLAKTVKEMIGKSNKEKSLEDYFLNHKIILGIDRLDYTKGMELRLRAIERFFEKYPEYIGKIYYIGVVAPSREAIPAYKDVKRRVKETAQEINTRFGKGDWTPIHLIHGIFSREELINFYKKADVCLVTPLDDGMNLVSKEFVISNSYAKDPGMLVLSQFAGSAIDLTEAIIINPYDLKGTADAIETALVMSKKEKFERINTMVDTLEDRNIYAWAQDFIKSAITSAKENRK